MKKTGCKLFVIWILAAVSGACTEETIDAAPSGGSPAGTPAGGNGAPGASGDGGANGAPSTNGGSTRSFDGGTTSANDGGKTTAPGEGGAALVPPTCVDTSKLPSWRQGMAVGEWREIASADLAQVTPAVQPGGYYSARIDAWNGFAADTESSKMYIGGAGGHADYAGNEVYSIDLNAAAPQWVLEEQPTPSSAYTIDKPLFTDGRPSPTHTYYTLWFIEGRQKLFRFGGGALWGTGNGSTDHIESWSPATKDWDADGTNPRIGGPMYEQPTTKHPYTGDVYQVGYDNHLRRWEQATNTVGDLGDVQGGTGSFYDLYKSPSVVDPVGQKVIYLSDGAAPAGAVRVFDIKTSAWSQVALSGSTTTAVAARESQAMAYYDACAKVIFVKTRSGGEVLLLDPATMGTSTLATSVAGPEDSLNGVHTLFQSLPKLGGYAYQPRHSSKLWFLATQ